MNKKLSFLFSLIFYTVFLLPSSEFSKDIDINNIEHIELLVAAPSNVSVASIAGHMYILIKEKNDINGLSRVIGFVANSGEDERNGISTLSYSFKGLIGAYKTIIQEETLYQMVARNTISENRDIYRLVFNFNKKQIKIILKELDKFKNMKNKKRYYFINRNCSSFLIGLINSALDKSKQIKDSDFLDLPLNIARKFYLKGIVKFYYPEYYSMSSVFKDSKQKREKIIKELLAIMGKEKDTISSNVKIKLFEILSGHILTDKEYDIIFNDFLRFSERINNINKKDRFLSAIYRFFLYTKNIEKYFVYKSDIKKKLLKNKKAKKEKVSNSIIKLTGIILKLRSKIKNPTIVEKEIKDSQTADKISLRRRKSVKPSISSIELGTNFHKSSMFPYFKYTLLFQNMGAHSLFSLNHNTKIRVLSFKKIMNNNQNIMSESCLFDFNKIYKSDRINYSGILNFGFGFRLLNNKIIDFEKEIYEKNIFTGEYIINFFEINDFLHYINIHLGAGFSSFKYNNFSEKYLNYRMELEGKTNLGYYYDNELRFSIKYGFSGKSIKSFETGIRLNLIFTKNSNIIFFSELKYKNIIFHDIKKHHTFYNFGIIFPLDLFF
jgi:hypothetical protein